MRCDATRPPRPTPQTAGDQLFHRPPPPGQLSRTCLHARRRCPGPAFASHLHMEEGCHTPQNLQHPGRGPFPVAVVRHPIFNSFAEGAQGPLAPHALPPQPAYPAGEQTAYPVEPSPASCRGRSQWADAPVQQPTPAQQMSRLVKSVLLPTPRPERTQGGSLCSAREEPAPGYPADTGMPTAGPAPPPADADVPRGRPLLPQSPGDRLTNQYGLSAGVSPPAPTGEQCVHTPTPDVPGVQCIENPPPPHGERTVPRTLPQPPSVNLDQAGMPATVPAAVAASSRDLAGCPGESQSCFGMFPSRFGGITVGVGWRRSM